MPVPSPAAARLRPAGPAPTVGCRPRRVAAGAVARRAAPGPERRRAGPVAAGAGAATGGVAARQQRRAPGRARRCRRSPGRRRSRARRAARRPGGDVAPAGAAEPPARPRREPGSRAQRGQAGGLVRRPSRPGRRAGAGSPVSRARSASQAAPSAVCVVHRRQGVASRAARSSPVSTTSSSSSRVLAKSSSVWPRPSPASASWVCSVPRLSAVERVAGPGVGRQRHDGGQRGDRQRGAGQAGGHPGAPAAARTVGAGRRAAGAARRPVGLGRADGGHRDQPGRVARGTRGRARRRGAARARAAARRPASARHRQPRVAPTLMCGFTVLRRARGGRPIGAPRCTRLQRAAQRYSVTAPTIPQVSAVIADRPAAGRPAGGRRGAAAP